MPTLRSPTPRLVSPSRRTFLAAAGTAAAVATTGCTAVLDALGDRLLDHVNVFNETDRRVSGSIEIVDPADAGILDATFDLASSSTDARTDDGDTVAVYEEVWSQAGSYDVTIELDDAIDGTSRAAETVAIADPDADRLAVLLGADGVDAAIEFRVGESFSDFARTPTDGGQQ